MDGFSQHLSDDDPPPGGVSAPEGLNKTAGQYAGQYAGQHLGQHQSSRPLSSQRAAKTSFATALQTTVSFVIATFSKEIQQQQLYYHNLDHVEGVAERALLIFDTVLPFAMAEVNAEIDWDRQRGLLYLCAIAHDMRQIFSPQTEPHAPRTRQKGQSELVTVQHLVNFIQQNNPAAVASLSQTDNPMSRFTAADIRFITEAIEATICQYDPTDGAIYQPALYPSDSRHSGQANNESVKELSISARCLALADIGTLGISGIEAYRHEGRLLLIEENLDILAFLQDRSAFDASYCESLRQRLLRRAKFEVMFAKGRLARLERELQGFPEGAIAPLKNNIFKHLTPATIQAIEKITPTQSDTTLETLIDYFQLTSTVERRPRL
ncbi:MAG: hypothetical protein AAFP09_03820 [Cyanobacteria bacterium J06607_10]